MAPEPDDLIFRKREVRKRLPRECPHPEWHDDPLEDLAPEEIAPEAQRLLDLGYQPRPCPACGLYKIWIPL